MNLPSQRIKGIAAGLISCCTVFPPVLALAQTDSASGPVELPIKMRQGDLMVEVPVNGSKPLAFKIDTGFGVTTIHPNLVDSLKLDRKGQLTIIGIAGEEMADTYGGAVFDFAGMKYEPRRVAALPSETRRRWRHRDGILGASFFRRFVVEIDIPRLVMRLHEPNQFEYAGKGEIIPITFKRDTPIIQATLVHEGLAPITAPFEIDTGCDDALCLGQPFVEEQRLLEGANANRAGVKRGVGGSAEIESGKLAELRLGKLTVKEPSTNFFKDGSPAGNGQAGHIGIGALQHFRIVFDYTRKRMILEAAD